MHAPKAHAGAGKASPKSLDDELRLEFFTSAGYYRKRCESCGKFFWTLDGARTRCGDNPCVQYSFIGAPLTKKHFEMRSLRENFLSFFEARGHKRVDPFPVIARWRTDIYLTTASIADFQPHVTSGLVPPPANPLTISQPCVRFTDLDSVGRSGRHLTSFEMMAHHAFNREGRKETYWKERTLELCDEWFVHHFGLARESITYKENPWFGGGNAGPAVEVLSGGLEIATLVFMFLEEDAEGTIPLGGSLYRPMPMKVVDTGYGLERILWASSGSLNLYQALYPELVDHLLAICDLGIDLKDGHVQEVLARHARLAGVMSLDTQSSVRELRKAVARSLGESGVRTSLEELEKLMGPLEELYAVADHTRTIPLLLTDGIVPSNVKGGYLARLLIRKTMRHLEDLKVDSRKALPELCLRQLERLKREREFKDQTSYIEEVLALEIERYAQTVEKGRRMVRTYLAKEKVKTVPLDALVGFYESHGIHPAIVKEAAAADGVAVGVPDAFLSIVAAKHAGEKQEKKRPRAFGVAPTRLLFYEEPNPVGRKEFDAKVLWSANNEVVLDQTLFFAETGGQPADHGVLEGGGRTWKVVGVQKEGDVIVHTLEGGPIPAGTAVRGRIDLVRRLGHAVHHTATHIVLACAIQVLGHHVWQAGTQKAEREARIDITHFDRLTPEDIDAIERRANQIVLADLPVEAVFIPRDRAEAKWGIRIFQGGVPEGGIIRVVTIKDTDVECCGGTHLERTGQVGSIRVKRTERIADGVERLIYSAGMAAVEEGQRTRALLESATDAFSVPAEELPKAAARFFTEWKERGKEIERLRAELAQASLKGGPAGELVAGVRVHGERSERPFAEMLTQAKSLAGMERAVGVFVSTADPRGPKLIVARTADVALDCREILRAALDAAGGGNGGGKPDFAQGAAPAGADAQKALEAARETVRRALEKGAAASSANLL